MLTATAASPAAAQALRGVATQLQSQLSAAVQEALLAQVQALGTALATGQPPAVTPPPGEGAEHPDRRR